MANKENLYQVLGIDNTSGEDGLSRTLRWIYVRAPGDTEIPVPSALGLQMVGDKLPQTKLRLRSWTVSEDATTGAVHYEAFYSTPDGAEKEEGEKLYRIESRGWRGTSVDMPLSYDVETKEAVLLPTGEPFSDVPSGARAGSVFYQTYLSPERSGAMAANCTVNSGAITIDGVSIPARCGRLTVSEEELVNVTDNPDYPFRYRVSVEVEVRHNLVKLTPNGQEEDIGHDVALLLQGFKYKGTVKDAHGNSVKAIVPFLEPDPKGGTKPATTPGFLKPDGTRLDDPSPTNCYYMRVASIKGATWSDTWFK